MHDNRSQSIRGLAVAIGTCLAMVIAPAVGHAQQAKSKVAQPVPAASSQPNTQATSFPHPVYLVLVKYEGRVVDAGGKPLQGMLVRLTGPGTYSATTNASGVFRFPGVKPGTYNITVSDPHHDYNSYSGQVSNLFALVRVPR